MKTFLRSLYIILPCAMVGLVYLMAAFYHLTFDISQFNQDTRGAIILCSFFVLPAGVLLALAINDKN